MNISGYLYFGKYIMKSLSGFDRAIDSTATAVKKEVEPQK
jgi:hypothetical protein